MPEINKAEQFVYQICRKSFLSLWSYANPIGKNGKELCDILVVCDPDIIIFSVKDIKVSNSGDPLTDWKRWHKRAVEESCQQLYGAERWIKTATQVIRKDGTLGLPFPQTENRRVHLISVALGGERKGPKSSGSLDGRGYVHVFDEISFLNILQELDTITNFVDYLVAKENLSQQTVTVIDGGGEEDILAFYLLQNRRFPSPELLIVDNTLWHGLTNDPRYEAKKKADRISYAWDNLIEIFCEDILNNDLEFGFTYPLNESEIALRIMAREGRFERRLLGKGITEFLNDDSSRARFINSPSEISYVFLSAYDEKRENVVAELTARCFVIRGLIPSSKTVVGVGIERSKLREGFALDLLYTTKNIWTNEDQIQLEYLQNELEIFKNVRPQTLSENEYPT